MKTIFLFFIGFLAFTGCKCAKNTRNSSNVSLEKTSKDIPMLKYEESTRGFGRTIVFESGTVSLTHRENGTTNNGKPKIATAENLTDLTKLYNDLTLENIHAVIVPSTAHQYDGAPVATFSVIVDGKTYKTPAFDGGNPPEEIAKIVNKLIEISGEKQ